MMQNPTIIGVGGFTSQVGKTSLMCALLRAFPGWEAIKTTRGHYRSCGKEPQSCCVSHLLSDEPIVRSGRAQTYEPGKDTGRYWEAGASNVHWLIATEEQVQEGIKQALGRVKAPGVFVEGNSFSEFVDRDFMVMVARSDCYKIKSSARRALTKSGALYVSGETTSGQKEHLIEWLGTSGIATLPRNLPVFGEEEQARLLALLQETCTVPAA